MVTVLPDLETFIKLEGTAPYAGLIQAPAEGQCLFLHLFKVSCSISGCQK